MVENIESDRLIESQDDETDSGINFQAFPTATGRDFTYYYNVAVSFINSLAYVLIGSTLIVIMWFVFKETPLTVFQQHILLCVLGYQLLMAQAILSLSPSNSWSSSMRLLHRRRVHWILQLLGSALAIAGSSVMIRHKTVHFTTTHGKLALSALIFTCVSLVNGFTSLYATELRRYIPANVSKIGHVSLGTAAFALSSVTLCFGYNKSSFKKWASDELAYLMMGITSAYTLIVITSPFFTLRRKMRFVIRN